MTRRFYLGSLLAIPAVVAILATIPGCPGPKTKTEPTKPGNTQGARTTPTETGSKLQAFVVEKTGGTIKGKVIYDGTPPVMPDLKQMEESGDKAQCHAGDKDHPYRHKQQTWIVGKDHGVANVVVSLEPPTGKYFALDKSEAEQYKDQENATIDQPYCVFEPHITAVFAAYKDKDGKLHDGLGQLTIKNSSALGHNTKLSETRANPLVNKTLNAGQSEKVTGIKYQKAPWPIACDKHTWMSAKLLTFEHPFFAVTDLNGNFEIKNVPTDVDLTLKTWHDDATEATEKVNAKKGETIEKELKIKAKTAS